MRSLDRVQMARNVTEHPGCALARWNIREKSLASIIASAVRSLSEQSNYCTCPEHIKRLLGSILLKVCHTQDCVFNCSL